MYNKEYRRQYYLKNRKKEIDRNKKYNREHKEKIKKYKKEYRQLQNKKEHNEYNKQWKNKNRDKVGRYIKRDIKKIQENSERRYGVLKNKAIYLKKEFNLSYEEYLMFFWNKKCYYCNGNTVGGMDRINNSKGYEIGNCVPCCYPCNYSKMNRSLKEFTIWVENLYRNLKRRELI